MYIMILPQPMHPVFCLQTCRQVKIVVVKNNIVAKLQVKPKGPTGFIGHQELRISPESLSIPLTLYLGYPPSKLHTIRKQGQDIGYFVLVLAKDDCLLPTEGTGQTKQSLNPRVVPGILEDRGSLHPLFWIRGDSAPR